MIKLTHVVPIALAVVLMGSLCTIARAADDPQDTIAGKIDQFMTEFLKENEFSGVVLYGHDSAIDFNKAYGLASRRYGVPNTVDTRFNIASLGKLFTSLAIAQLAERGRLAFDDPIGKYLDDKWVAKDAGEKITIMHLLSHTSGLKEFFTPAYFNTGFAQYRELDDFSPLIEKELDFEPGSQVRYCNTNFLLLGVILEKVTGQNFRDYFQENIFDPAGMTRTGYFAQDIPVPEVATGYFTDEQGIVRNNIFVHMTQGTSAGGGYATTEDFWKFGRAFRHNVLCNEETKVRLTTREPGQIGFGYGWPVRGGRMMAAGGITGVAAFIRLDFATGQTIVILSNFGNAQEVFQGINKILDEGATGN